MREVVIIGVGMTRFGKFLEKSLQGLGREAVWNAIDDAGIPPKDIQIAYVANSLGYQLTELKGTIGQHVLAATGFFGIPIIDVENACSSGSTALRCACLEVASGSSDVALALGVEKLFCDDTAKSAEAMASGTPYGKFGFMVPALYAMNLKKWMEKYSITQEHFAKVTVKNSRNGSLNPNAQFRKPLSMEDVLNSRVIAYPLTLYMCSTMGDGAAAAVICTKDAARKYTTKPLIEVASCELLSGTVTIPDQPQAHIEARTAELAYQKAGIGPEDVNVAEVHDGMAPAELMIYEELGFPGEKVHKDRSRADCQLAFDEFGAGYSPTLAYDSNIKVPRRCCGTCLPVDAVDMLQPVTEYWRQTLLCLRFLELTAFGVISCSQSKFIPIGADDKRYIR